MDRADTRWVMSSSALSDSPSRRDGLKAEEEKKKRRQTMSFVEECGRRLKLRKLVVVVAETYLNRFYALQSFKKYDRFATAQACLFLAAKVEEQPMRIDRIVNECHSVRFPRRDALDAEAFLAAKHRVLEYERVLLYSIQYDLDIVNLLPVTYLETILRNLARVGVKVEEKFSQQCWTIIQDSHRTTLTLEYQPIKIASACVFLTFLKFNLFPSDKNKVLDIFKVLSISERSLNAICASIVELYLEMGTASTQHVDLIAILHAKKHISDDLYRRCTTSAPESHDVSSSPSAKRIKTAA